MMRHIPRCLYFAVFMHRKLSGKFSSSFINSLVVFTCYFLPPYIFVNVHLKVFRPEGQADLVVAES